MLTASYKQVRREDDLNQPLSVQPWGEDGFKRKYWLIEGREGTEFRLYRESNAKVKDHRWWSVAGSIDDLKGVGVLLSEEGSQAARRLSERITLAIPRLEACQEVSTRGAPLSWYPLPVTDGDSDENVGSTVSRGRLNSLGPSPAGSPCTKDERGARS